MVDVRVIGSAHMLRRNAHGLLDAREDRGAAGMQRPVEGVGGAVFFWEVGDGGDEIVEGWCNYCSR